MAEESAGTSSPERIEIAESWGKERLMGKSVSFKGIAPEDLDGGQENGAPEKSKRRRSSMKAADMKIDPMLWGQPGHLTEEEADVYVSVYTYGSLRLSRCTCDVDDVPRVLVMPGTSWSILNDTIASFVKTPLHVFLPVPFVPSLPLGFSWVQSVK